MKKECKHINWEVKPEDRFGTGWCLDCKKPVGLCVLFNNLKKRMEAIIEKFEKKKNDI